MRCLISATVLALALALALAGCGGGGSSDRRPAEATSTSAAASSAPAAATGCTATGLDAMTALSDFQLEMDAAQKEGKLTVDQLTAARDKLYNETQAAAANEDWGAYCAAIDSMRTELAL